MWHIDIPRLGVKLELQLPTYTTVHGNAGSLTHWTRPGIEPVFSWILVGFVTTELQQQLWGHSLLSITHSSYLCKSCLQFLFWPLAWETPDLCSAVRVQTAMKALPSATFSNSKMIPSLPRNQTSLLIWPLEFPLWCSGIDAVSAVPGHKQDPQAAQGSGLKDPALLLLWLGSDP